MKRSRCDARGRVRQESSVGNLRQHFLCDYMFNLLHISKIVCYDRANLQWSPCECQANEKKAAMKSLPTASNGISMNPCAGGSERPDSSTIRAGDWLLPEHHSPQHGIYYHFFLPGWNAANLEGKVWGRRKEGGEAWRKRWSLNLDLLYLNICHIKFLWEVVVGGWRAK